MRLEFEAFLKDQKAYDNFMVELRRQRAFDSIEEWLQAAVLNPRQYLFGAFSWTTTLEGGPYWRDMAEKWAVEIQYYQKGIKGYIRAT